MFDKLRIEEARDELLPKIKHMNPTIIEDSSKRFYASIQVKDRKVEIKLISLHRNSVTVDVIDPFGFIRIPRKTFKKKEDFQLFIMMDISKIYNAI